MRPLTLAQAVAAAVLGTRLARGRRRAAPLAPHRVPRGTRVSVIVPARDEAARIAPCLEALTADPDVHELLVVDDCSSDGTADIARSLGAQVVPGRPPERGWVGKPWALQQGLEAAAGDVVVALDADTRPRRGLLGALVAELDAGADWVTCGPRFVCETPGERLLHPALLATLVYRFGPADAERPARVLANGQCTAARRAPFLAGGGYGPALGHMTDDLALARALADAGSRVVFRDASALLEVRMHETAGELWREWGRSIAMPDVLPASTRAADVAVVWLTMALPLLRRATPLDRALLAVRWALGAQLARGYRPRGPLPYLAPLADPVAAVRLTASALRPARSWRGRTYGA